MLFCKFGNTVVSKTTIESKSATKPFVNVSRPSKAENKIIPIIESDSTNNLKIADTKQAVTGVHSSVPKTKGDELVPLQSHSEMDSEMPQGIICFQNNSIFCLTIFRCLDSLKKNQVFRWEHTQVTLLLDAYPLFAPRFKKKNERTENIWKSVSALN